jgi:hypothetical protein
MSTRGPLLSRFPPGVPLWPGLLLGLVAATVAGYAQAHGYWPPALPLPPGNHLHPLALFGHGLALALVVTLVLEALRLRPRWQEAEDCSPSEPHWAGAAVRDCLDLLPARCTFKAYEKKLLEVQQRWATRLDRRWLWYYCAALGLIVPGAVLVPLGLRPSSQPQPDPVTLFEPLAVAAMETVVVFLFALRLRIRWGDVLQLWVEAALEGQKRNARLRRKRSAEVSSVAAGLQPAGAVSAGYKPAATEEPPPPPPSHPTSLPDASAFAVPLAPPPVEMATDEVELVFDNDGYEEEGLPR